MASRAELSAFLASVEKRAFKHAAWSLQDEEAALDAVQDAMMKLSANYGDRPAAELPLLFQRILQNVIRDSVRRRKVRRAWITLFSGFMRDGDDSDPLDSLDVDPAADLALPSTPHGDYERARVLDAIEEEIARLPERQRQAFLLRYWEGFDTVETAAVMGCSEGSVKTHCSRAVRALSTALLAKGISA
ncbi:RNA polymerase sigma factor [Pseudothauera nasutitermitis]|uniref:RNA polymerase sigma factor n=1 Tax=Pseudothauera nasutitermitis TaxID=2565930 RepID=A0A4S4ASK3_9RHOO|nr:RNA polymerase sigma factor [Pseudothauera nasutitermitis]